MDLNLVLGLDDNNIVPETETIEENFIDEFINDFSYESSLEHNFYSDDTETLIECLEDINKNLKNENYTLEEAFTLFNGLDKILKDTDKEDIQTTLFNKIDELETNKLNNIINSFEDEEIEMISTENKKIGEGPIRVTFVRINRELQKSDIKPNVKWERFSRNFKIFATSFVVTFAAITIAVSVYLLIRGFVLSDIARQTKNINNMKEDYDPDRMVLLLPETQLNKALKAVDSIFDDAVKAIEKIAKGQTVDTNRTSYFKYNDLGMINAHKGNLWKVSNKSLRLHNDTLENHGYVRSDFEKYKKEHRKMKEKVGVLINKILDIRPTTKVSKKALREVMRVVKYAFKIIMFQIYAVISSMGTSS